MQGYIGRADEKMIAGWVFMEDDETPVEIIIAINGIEHCKIIANGYREDLKMLGKHATGYCGFDFRQFDPELITHGATVEVMNAKTNEHLINSPYKIYKRINDCSEEYRPLIFVHIPKTSGTSFRIAVENSIESSFILKDYGLESQETSAAIKLYDQKKEMILEHMCENKISFLTGHFHAQKYLPFFKEDVRWCVFLRDPILRIISEYKHLKNTQSYDGDFISFYRQEAQINRQSKLIGGIDIEKFFFLGITERYDESISLFNQLTNLDIPVYVLNVAKDDSDETRMLEEEILEELVRLNQKDIALYQKGLELLDKRYNAYV